jgi:hypothetical protein
MTTLPTIVVVAVTAGAARQVFVLSGILRSGRFLRRGKEPQPEAVSGGLAPVFFIVVPVLREAAILPEAVAHFRMAADGHDATVLIVTTAREAAAAGGVTTTTEDTVALAAELARQGRCDHIHYPDASGLKADQLNYAAARCAACRTRCRLRESSWCATTPIPGLQRTAWAASQARSPKTLRPTSSISPPGSNYARASGRLPGHWAGLARSCATPRRSARTDLCSALKFPGFSIGHTA